MNIQIHYEGQTHRERRVLRYMGLLIHKHLPNWSGLPPHLIEGYTDDAGKFWWNAEFHGIGLTRRFVATANNWNVKHTILHEIAHALRPKGEGHSQEWFQTARSLGKGHVRLCSQSLKELKANGLDLTDSVVPCEDKS